MYSCRALQVFFCFLILILSGKGCSVPRPEHEVKILYVCVCVCVCLCYCQILTPVIAHPWPGPLKDSSAFFSRTVLVRSNLSLSKEMCMPGYNEHVLKSVTLIGAIESQRHQAFKSLSL